MACNVQVFRARRDIWILHLKSLGFYRRCPNLQVHLDVEAGTADRLNEVSLCNFCVAWLQVSKLVDGCRIYKNVKEKPSKGLEFLSVGFLLPIATVLGHSVTDLWSDTTKLALAGIKGGLANIHRHKMTQTQ